MEQLKRNKDLAIIYACAIVCSVVLILECGVQECPDSPTYVSAWDNFVNGKIDMLRTPVYPCFLGVMKSLFGEQLFRIATIYLQHVIFLISVYYFYRIAQHFISNRRVVFIVSFCYATISLFTTWNNFILTESFAISGVVILVYTIICLRQTPSYISAILYTLILLMLIFLRPALVYMLPILIIAWISLWGKKHKVALLGISGTLIVIASLFVYMKAFEREYGLFASSRVGTINQLSIARQYGLLDPNVITDTKLKTQVIESYRLYGERLDDLKDVYKDLGELYRVADIKELDNAISNSFKNNPMAWISACGGRLIKSLYSPLFCSYIKLNIVRDIISLDLKLKLLYIFVVVYVIVLFIWIVRNHCIPWFSSLFCLACIGNIIVSIVGAQAEWSRLILPSMPLFLLMVGQICTMFKIKSLSSIKFH